MRILGPALARRTPARLHVRPSAMAVVKVPTGGLSELTTEELTRLLEIAQGLAGSLDLDDLLEKVVDSARTLLGGDMSTLLLLDRERAYLNVRASSGIDSEIARQLSTALGRNLAGLVAEDGRAMRTVDIGVDPRSTLGRVCSSVICSSILVPLTNDHTVLGVLAVETRERREFTDHDEIVLELLASSASTAIETARLYQVERDHVQRLELLVHEVNKQNDMLRRTRDAHDTLTDASLLGVGRDGLVEILRERIPSPIAVTDPFGRRLNTPVVDDDQGERLWADCAQSPILARQLEQYRCQAGRSDSARIMKSGFWRLVPIAAAGELLGALVALKHSSLDELHMRTLEDAANILASELLRERSVALAEARADGDVVRMVFSFPGSVEDLQQRAALLGYDIRTRGYVVVLGPSESRRPLDSDALSLESRRAATAVGIRSLAGVVDGEATVILTAGSRPIGRGTIDDWIGAVSAALSAPGGSPDLRFGVSAQIGGDDDVREARNQARQAVRFGALGNGTALQYFEDVRLASLMDLTDRDAVERFVNKQIGELIGYDERKGGDLVATLEAYLDCSGVTLHAAKALCLHPHSLRYRLKRISEIQGLPLEDPMTRLAAHLAVKFHALS